MDTRLALGYQGVQIPDQTAPLRNALALHALQGQSELQGLQIGEARRSADDSRTLRALAAEANGDPEKLSQSLLRAGRVQEALGLRKAINEERNTGLEAQKKKGELGKQTSERESSNANAIINASPQDRPMVYSALRQQEIALGNENAANSPEQWDDRLLPLIIAHQQRGLTSQQSQERQDYAATAQSPTVAALSAPQGSTVLPPAAAAAEAGLLASPVRTPAANPPMDPIEVSAKAPADTPDSLRARAKDLRTRGTKAAADVAKDLEAEANRLEARGLEEQKLEDAKRNREETAANRKATQGQKDREFENKLGDDFKSEPTVKNYRTVQPIIASMEEAAKKDTAGSDLNMVYAISKIFDPDSVVREGEQIMVRNSGGLPSVLQSALGFVVGGQRLSPQLREEILAEGRSRAGVLKQGHDQLAASYRQQATEQGINPDRVVRTFDIKQTSGAGPRKGAGAGTQSDPFKIQGQDGFDAMPSGAFFTGPDGSLRRKP